MCVQPGSHGHVVCLMNRPNGVSLTIHRSLWSCLYIEKELKDVVKHRRAMESVDETLQRQEQDRTQSKQTNIHKN